MTDTSGPNWEGFVRKLFEGWPEPYGTALDGMDMQDLGETYGVLIGETRTESCGEGCNCIEYYGPDDGPWVCYRLAPTDKPE
jgi:hypothetical protein